MAAAEAAVEAEAGAAVVVAVAVAGRPFTSSIIGNRPTELHMLPIYTEMKRWQGMAAAVIIGTMLAIPHASAADAAKQASDAKKAAAPKQKTYGTPEEAVKDLIAAAKAGDAKALVAILGPQAKPILSSGDPVADREGRALFIKSYDEANKLDKSGDAKAVLSTGKDNWPFPIPL